MHVICPRCSFYYKVEISGRRQQADCPQCGAFAGRVDHERGLVVMVVCRRCTLGYPVDVTSPRASAHCSGCDGAPKQRDMKLLGRIAEIHRLRSHPPAETAPGAEGRVNVDDMDPGPELVRMVPESIALAYRCVPIRFENDVLTVALPEPVRDGVLDDLGLMLKCTVRAVGTPKAALERAIRRCYGPPQGA